MGTLRHWSTNSARVGWGSRDAALHFVEVAKKIGIALLALLLVLAAGLAWVWHRITALPEWYGSADMVAEDGSPRVDPDWVAIPHAPNEPPRYQIRNPHLRSDVAKQAPVAKAIKASRATWQDEARGSAIDAGAVVNLADADLDAMTPKERADFEKAIDAFPALTERDVYVGIEGKVYERNGELRLGDDAKIRIGETHYSLATAAKRLGMSEAELRKAIEKELHRLDVHSPASEPAPG